MNFIDVMFSEIKYIRRQGLTTLLIFTYPLVIILLLAQAFSVAEFEKVNVAISATSEKDLNQIMNMSPSNVNLVAYSDAQGVMDAVRQGDAAIGMIAVRGNDARLKITFYEDPVKGYISTEVVSKMENIFGAEARGYIEENVVGTWKGLNESLGELKSSVAQIPGLKAELSNASAQLDNVNSELDVMSGELNSTSAELDDIKSSINGLGTYNNDLASFDSELSNTRSKLVSVQGSIPTWRSKIQTGIRRIDSSIASLDEYIASIEEWKTLSDDPDWVATLDEYERNATATRAELVQAKNDLTAADTQLAEAQNDVSDGISQIDSAKAKISSARSSLSAFQSNMMAKMERTKSRIVSFESKINSYKAGVATSKEKVYAFGLKLDQTESLLRRTILQMEVFAKKNPLDYAPPEMVAKYIKDKLRTIEIFLPAVIGLVAMLSCLLFPMLMSVRQADEGIEFRYKMSTTSRGSILIGRFLGNYLVGMLQAVIIAGFSIVALNVGYYDLQSYGVAILITPAVFIAIGYAISFFVSRESTAVLLTLLLSIPMLFLSGIMIPHEHIFGFMKTVSLYLPLTQVTEMLNNVTIRSLPLPYSTGEITVLSAYIVASLIIGYFAIGVKMR